VRYLVAPGSRHIVGEKGFVAEQRLGEQKVDLFSLTAPPSPGCPQYSRTHPSVRHSAAYWIVESDEAVMGEKCGEVLLKPLWIVLFGPSLSSFGYNEEKQRGQEPFDVKVVHFDHE
jgi:hypothetical protein